MSIKDGGSRTLNSVVPWGGRVMLSWEIYHTHLNQRSGRISTSCSITSSYFHWQTNNFIWRRFQVFFWSGETNSPHERSICNGGCSLQKVHYPHLLSWSLAELRGWPEVNFSHINLWTALGLNGSMSHWRKKHKNNTEDDTVFSFRAHVGSSWQINGEIKSPFWGFVDRPPIKPCTSSDLLPSVFTEWNTELEFFKSSESIFIVLCLAS